MKRTVWILSLLLCLSGCWALAADVPQTEPPVIVMSSPQTAAPPSSIQEAHTTEPLLTESFTTVPVTSEMTTSEQMFTEPLTNAIPYQDGDTTRTWRPELAVEYPPDTQCSSALLLEKWMAVEGLSMDDLDRRGCGQLILTVAQPSDGVETIVICFERDDGGSFVPVNGLCWLRGHVGKAGILHDRRRNTNTSPAGLWALSFAFGNEAPPEGLKLPWRQVTPNSDWVCDEDSPYFNTWRERGESDLLPWSGDVEHLEDYPALYAWACVIEFNRPPDVIPARGCAIFLHCSEKATGGCVGLPHDEMGAVLQWLDPEKNPYILITGVQVTP